MEYKEILDDYYDGPLIDDEKIKEDDGSIILYELIFNLVSRLLINEKDKKNAFKIMNIVLKLVQNILDRELLGEDSEKYRKLKLSNNNIALVFNSDGSYDFFRYLGFKEFVFENELFLYLEKNLIDINKLTIASSYLNLLILNEVEGSKNYQNKNQDLIEQQFDLNQISNQNNSQYQSYTYKKAGIIDILKNTKDVRLGKSFLVPHNYNLVKVDNPIQNDNNNRNQQNNNELKKIKIKNPYYKPKDGKTMLKETAYMRANNYNPKPREYYDNQIQQREYNDRNRKNNINNNQYPSLGFINNENYYPLYPEDNTQFSRGMNNNQPREMRVPALLNQNPQNANMGKVKEMIGKICLQLTNDFRKANNLSPLTWDDEIWRIAYTHSMNMGLGKVPFGHQGFQDRINKFSFFSSYSCENVFMSRGMSQYLIANLGVNGWINSPSHRKNLLSVTTHCAIASYMNDNGEFYLTQLFARKGE